MAWIRADADNDSGLFAVSQVTAIAIGRTVLDLFGWHSTIRKFGVMEFCHHALQQDWPEPGHPQQNGRRTLHDLTTPL
jgi:hypothetical protein